MVSEESPTNSKLSKNKGVNVTSDSLHSELSQNAEVVCDCEDASEPVTVRRVREQLQSVIEFMEPNTPHFTHNSSSEADNEESVIESSVYSSVIKMQMLKTDSAVPKAHNRKERTISTTNSPRENTDISATFTTETQCGAINEMQHPLPCPHGINCVCSWCNQQRLYNPAYMHQGCGGQHMAPFYYENERMSRKDKYEKQGFLSKLLGIDRRKRGGEMQAEYYKMNVKQSDDHSPPKRLVFNLVQPPKPDCRDKYTNTKVKQNNVFQQSSCRRLSAEMCQTSDHHVAVEAQTTTTRQAMTATQTVIARPDVAGQPVTPRQAVNAPTYSYNNNQRGLERVDVYYFDHGNSAYYRTTDSHPAIMAELVAEKTDTYTTKFWAELFGTVHIGFAFVTSFLVQSLRFVLYSILRPIVVGFIQLMSDYLFKPFLSVLFNNIIQPLFILLFNMAISIRDLCDPLAQCLGYFLRECAIPLRAFRLVEVNYGCKYHKIKSKSKCQCGIRDEEVNEDFYGKEEGKEGAEKNEKVNQAQKNS